GFSTTHDYGSSSEQQRRKELFIAVCLQSLGVVAGAPAWTSVESWSKPEGQVRTSCYSQNGSIYAVSTSHGIYIYDVTDTDTIKLLKLLPVKNAIEISLSPKGTYLSTWVRPVKLAEDGQHKNMQIFSTAPEAPDAPDLAEEPDEHIQHLEQAEIASFTQKAQDGWKLQFTDDEAFALRSIQNAVHILDPNKAFSLSDKLNVEGLSTVSLSPGKNPYIAVFVAERKGMPGSVRIHALSTLVVPSIQKTFYNADRGQMKWNSSGTSLLFLSSTDHDKTGKSYYGETNLYLMTPALQYEARVTLAKEGGIGDFAWNPANGGKEFAVSYGFMPAKTTLFDMRLNVLHEFGSLPRNYVSFNPQGRLLCIAGFGNLAGQVDIWDRSTLRKVANFQASNCTECVWSPDGRFLMCNTLSPRLRVDNGIKIYHWSGELVHIETIVELNQAAWRPMDASNFTFQRTLSPAPPPSVSIQLLTAQKAAGGLESDRTAASPKPGATGAYRPPGLRNREVPNIFKREDEGGAPYTPTKNGVDRNSIPGMSTQQNGSSGRGRGRIVPGAGPPTDGQGRGQGKRQDGGKLFGQKKGKKDYQASPIQGLDNLTLDSTITENSNAEENTATAINIEPNTPSRPTTSSALSSEKVSDSPLTPEDKKRRALQKKLGAIESLKAKKAAGEKLEKTQEKKIEAEAEVRKELADVGGQP
ncbi:MAG: hypothetical protein CYPHOPRED_002725, partial [Cyphobasidiales sp. Tagirdzhanova-0007]